MLDLYAFQTPNVIKVAIFLEETGLEYNVINVDIGKREQFKPDFLAISPNHRVPTIVDHEPTDGGEPLAVFESAAILTYLAEKTGRYLPAEPRKRAQVTEWMYWQMAGLGPMAAQFAHFKLRAPKQIPYALNRYRNETNRLYRVLNHQLKDRHFVAEDYSIADMICYPWFAYSELFEQDLTPMPNLAKWIERVEARPAVQSAKQRIDKDTKPTAASPEEFWDNVFGPDAAKDLYR